MRRKLKETLYKYWPIMVITFISAVVYHRWLNVDVFAYQDWGWQYFKETDLSVANPTLWQGYQSLGGMDVTLFKVPIYLAYGFLAILGYDGNVSDKIIYFWPFVFLTGINSYFLIHYLLKNKLAAFIGSLVYCYNTYFLAITTQGHLSLTLAATFAPLGIFFFIKALDENRISLSIWSALVLFVSAFYDFRVFYIALFILIFYFLYFILIEKSSENKFNWIKNKVLVALAFGLVSLGLNLYWMLTFFQSNFLTTNDGVSRDLVPFSLNISRAVTLFHPFWTGVNPQWFDGQTIPFYFWFIPIIALVGLVMKRDNKRVVFFGVIAILGVFLSKQTEAPFGEVYYWLRAHLPGFGAFREASKFYFITVLSYSVLIAAFVSWISSRKNPNKFQKYGQYALVTLIIFLFIWNTRSIVNGNMTTLFSPKTIPQDNLKFKEILDKDQKFSRVLWIPSEPFWALWDNYHPKMNAIEMKRSEWGTFSEEQGQGDSVDTSERLIITLTQPFSSNLLNDSSVKYIVAEKNSFFQKKLDQITYLKKTSFNFENMIAYENPTYRPHIYLTNQIESIHRNYSFKEVEYSQKNPSWYIIRLKNIKEPVYLNFSEKYHPAWNLYVGNFHWYDEFFSKRYPLPDENHYQTDAKLNSFYVDPQEIKNDYPDSISQVNPDGSMDVELNLFFRPQSYLYLGLLIMGMTALISAGYLVWDWKKRHNRKS